jgi:hypothetical protein
MVFKLSKWVLFGVIVSIVPLAYSYLNLLIKSKPATLQQILGGGELLIVVSAMCAGAVGEMIGTKSTFVFFKLVSAGSTIVILILSTLTFATVTEARSSQAPVLDLSVVETTSLFLFAFGILTCASCIALSEL